MVLLAQIGVPMLAPKFDESTAALSLRVERSDDDVASLVSIGVVTKLHHEPTLDRIVLRIDLTHVDSLPLLGNTQKGS